MSPKRKNRNYSFKNSKKLSIDKMTEVNGVPIPSVPGSCYHAILCALASNKNKFLAWDRIIELTEKYMRQYGGSVAWDKFKGKSEVKDYEKRIRDNAHTLTRTGKDCYGFRLHERGMAMYYFKDGAMLLTGGEYLPSKNGYKVKFSNGMGLQTRYRGSTMTYHEYKVFLENDWIDSSGTLINSEAIRNFRSGKEESDNEEEIDSADNTDRVQVSITLDEDMSDDFVSKLKARGLKIEHIMENEIIGTVPKKEVNIIQGYEEVVDMMVLDQE